MRQDALCNRPDKLNLIYLHQVYTKVVSCIIITWPPGWKEVDVRPVHVVDIHLFIVFTLKLHAYHFLVM